MDLISLEDFRAQKLKKAVRSQSRNGEGLTYPPVPTELKGVLTSSGNLVCPKCHAKLCGVRSSHPPGWNRKRALVKRLQPFQLLCAFGCSWKGGLHLKHRSWDWDSCTECVQNPNPKPTLE
jgi:hypothetical protein